MLDFDVILGITWLSQNHNVLNYNSKIVTLDLLGMNKLERERVYKAKMVRIISFI